MGLPEIDVHKITEAQRNWTVRWHTEATDPEAVSPWREIELNHRMNFAIWHEEDIARRDDLGSDRIREAKRTIDRCNQSRNDAAEQIDAWIMEHLVKTSDAASVHSETPGMMIDRLSILALKHYHMDEEANRETAGELQRTQCRLKADRIRLQLGDLRDCLSILLTQLASGDRAFKLYRQFKMYNDPDLNPELYRNTNK